MVGMGLVRFLYLIGPLCSEPLGPSEHSSSIFPSFCILRIDPFRDTLLVA